MVNVYSNFKKGGKEKSVKITFNIKNLINTNKFDLVRI